MAFGIYFINHSLTKETNEKLGKTQAYHIFEIIQYF